MTGIREKYEIKGSHWGGCRVARYGTDNVTEWNNGSMDWMETFIGMLTFLKLKQWKWQKKTLHSQ